MNADEPTMLAMGSTAVTAEDLIREAEAALDRQVEFFGELGRSPDGTVALLGRDRSTGRMVAVRIRAALGAPGTYQVDVLRQLDSSLPEIKSECPGCHSVLHSWSRFCPYCATDLSGVAVSQSRRTREELLELVRRACVGRYDVLGEMDRPEGGGLVYFGRDVQTGTLVAMRLTETSEAQNRRSSVERRSGVDRRTRERRTRQMPVSEERRGAANPKYALDLTKLINPLEEDSGT
jgi:hypothetical protein